MPLPRVVTTLAALLALLAIGCGTETIEPGSVEDDLAGQFEGFEFDCDDDAEAKEGEAFNCTATSPDGEEIELRGTQADDEGNIEFNEEDVAKLGAAAGGAQGE